MLKLTVTWEDIDIIECLVEARSTMFAGTARLFFTAETLRELAQAIAGFPESSSDRRTFSTTNSEEGNRCDIVLSCYSGLAAATASVHITNNEERGEEARVVFAVEATAIDVFEREVLAIARERSGEALLLSVP
jgi:hypothetical protein